MEISGGLNHGAVSRQKKLWSEVPEEALASTLDEEFEFFF